MKKKTKKRKIMKKTIFISIFILLVIIGVFLFVRFSNKTYLNMIIDDSKGCRNGYYFYNIIVSSGCKECSKGKYCPGDNKQHDCPKGVTTHGKGSISSSDCKYCKDETKYYKNGKCTQCPSGYYCEKGTLKACPICYSNKTRIKCFTSPAGSKSANKCYGTVPAGKYITCSPSSGCVVKTCEGNTYSKAKKVNYSTYLSTKCSKCPNNKVANATHTGCVDLVCKTGEYKKNGKCVKCPLVNNTSSWFTSPAGSTSISQCTVTLPAGRNLTCNSTSCKSSSCTGNTYSITKTYSFKANLKVKCQSCGKKKATWDHTGCA